MSDMEMPEELAGQPVISFATVPDCKAWFAEHHTDDRGRWLKIGKVGAAETVNYAEALEVALCHGWIDGRKRGHDETCWLQRFTPRGPRNRCSRINRDMAEALIKAGRLRPAGQARVDAATAGGRWTAACTGQKSATVPDDVAAALAGHRLRCVGLEPEWAPHRSGSCQNCTQRVVLGPSNQRVAILGVP